MSPAESLNPERGNQKIFDTLLDGHIACRVCGALVVPKDPCPRIHWDWHEASNGA
jgi:hypothetical protein